jgi:hypothetical protein
MLATGQRKASQNASVPRSAVSADPAEQEVHGRFHRGAGLPRDLLEDLG